MWNQRICVKLQLPPFLHTFASQLHRMDLVQWFSATWFFLRNMLPRINSLLKMRALIIDIVISYLNINFLSYLKVPGCLGPLCMPGSFHILMPSAGTWDQTILVEDTGWQVLYAHSCVNVWPLGTVLEWLSCVLQLHLQTSPPGRL